MEQSNTWKWNPPKASYPAGKRELIFGAVLLFCCLIWCNFTLFGGFNLGFAIGTVLCMVCSLAYLWPKGKKNIYALSVLALCAVIAVGFARSDDGFVKFVMVCFLLVGINMSYAQLAGRNLWKSGSLYSLLDSLVTFFNGIGKLEHTFRGLTDAVRQGGKFSKNGMSVLLGLGIAVPVLAIVIPLLISADAAFDGLMKLLPEFKLNELMGTLVFGIMCWGLLLSRGMALRFEERQTEEKPSRFKGLAVLTLNTVLIAVCFVYVVYLVSQLAYFVGGFAGILPEEYTLAQYARRGFFEMAWLCAINLGIIACSMGLCGKKDPVPLFTRILCLFVGVVTVFFVTAASAKMFLYIGSYGLTRLRVLTQIIMLFLALTTVLVCVRLFVPKMKYMQAVVLSALVIGGLVIWTDVDTQVANYNVDAYLSGRLNTVDVKYLSRLGDGAVPAIARLADKASTQEVREKAAQALENRYFYPAEDFRGWNYAAHTAEGYLPKEEAEEEASVDEDRMEIDRSFGAYFYNTTPEALCVGDGFVCLRGWKNATDEPVYCLAFPDGGFYEPVKSEKALLELFSAKGIDTASYGNWIPFTESEFCSGQRYAALRGRSIEEDVTLWYVLDMENNTTHGPYRTEDEYWQACYDLGASPIGEWEPADDFM